MSEIEEYWASFFGLSTADFVKSELKIMPHAQFQGWSGAWLLRRGPSIMISAPDNLVGHLEAEFQSKSRSSITDEEFIALFGDKVDKVLGPAYQGYLEGDNFRPVSSSARLLSSTDDGSLRDLAAACDPIEWEHGDIEAEKEPNFGYFVDSQLVAVSSYRMETETAASPGIITHPDHRNLGYAKAVLSSATEHGLKQGFLMLYQTLVANKPAVAAAESLGYKQYATSLAVRLL